METTQTVTSYYVTALPQVSDITSMRQCSTTQKECYLIVCQVTSHYAAHSWGQDTASQTQTQTQHQCTGQGEATQGHTDIQTTATSSSSVGYTTAESVEDSV